MLWQNSKIDIIYEDNHLLAAVKPPGVLAQADGSSRPDMLNLLKADIKIRYQKPGQVYLGLVHRLDMPVGGIMIFARTSKAAARISRQIREHSLKKYYLAVVDGRPEPAAGELIDYLKKNKQENLVRTTSAQTGNKAWLSYVTLDYSSRTGRSLLAIKLGSGRPHQIRVQLASRGWPIAGDRRYGKGNGKENNIALFAAAIGLMHPVKKEYMLFSAAPLKKEPWLEFYCPDGAALPEIFFAESGSD